MNIYGLSLYNVATAEVFSIRKRFLCLWELGGCFVFLVRLSTIVTYLQFCRILASSKIYLVQSRENQEKEECTCPVPCKRVLYEQHLSYALLSRKNIEKFVLDDDREKRLLEVKSNANNGHSK